METPLQGQLDLAAIGSLTFRAPDEVRFPATRLARAAAEAGGGVPAVLNAANEVAVAAFLAGGLGFAQIAALVDEVLTRFVPARPASLEDVYAVDAEARVRAGALLPAMV
jgi:1-deoxy-D-xylulose-5-phosphate reductoisomerase